MYPITKSILILVVVGLFLVGLFDHVQATGQVFVDMNKELESIKKEEMLKADEQKVLDAEKKRYNDIDELIKGAENRFREEINQWQTEFSNYKAERDRRSTETERHNASKPDPLNHAAVNAYNTEAARLNTWRDRLEAQHNRIEDRRKTLIEKGNGLKQARENLNKAVLDWATKQKRLNNDFEVLRATNESLRQKFVATCQQMLRDPSTKDEALKLGCGNVQFDGANPNLPHLEEKDIKPPFQAHSR